VEANSVGMGYRTHATQPLDVMETPCHRKMERAGIQGDSSNLTASHDIARRSKIDRSHERRSREGENNEFLDGALFPRETG